MKKGFLMTVRWALAAAVFLLCSGAVPARAATAPRPEPEVKAEFLPVFAEFIRWPQACFPATNAPLIIGVLGADVFGEALDRAVAKARSAAGRTLELKRSHRFEDLKDCHLVFICKSEAAQLPQVLAATEGRSVLTVSEVAGFAQQGGVINFVLEDRKVRFEINAEAARRKGLQVSSQLLGVARVVKGKGGGK